MTGTARQQKKHEQCIRLNEAALDNAPTPKELAQHWQRICDNFNLLYDAPETVGQLRQAILQLAVQGKLVAQDGGDELAAVLLEKQYILPEGYQRKKKIIKKTPVNLPDELFPKLPKSWVYCGIQDLYNKNIIIEFADGNHGSLYPRKSEFGEIGIVFVSAKDIVNGRVTWDKCSKLSEEKAKMLTKGWAEGGDVLLTHNATVGRVARVEANMPRFLLGTSVTFYRLNNDAIDADYFYYLLKSRVWQGQLEAIMSQTTRNQVSIQKQAFFKVPIPPLNEQKRIVAKVDQLMALCDELEAGLVKAQNDGGKLMEAVVHNLLLK